MVDILGADCGFYCACERGKIAASLELKPHHGIPYAAKNAHDLSYKTAWVEGVQGDGIGENLIYCFPPTNPRIIKVIVIKGYSKSDETWRNNSRVKQRKRHYHQRRQLLAWQKNSRVKLLKMYVDNKPYALLHLAARKATGLNLTKIIHKTMRHFTIFFRRKVSHMYLSAYRSRVVGPTTCHCR
ncbi:hypothetical protein [uncultured Bacteroides sp.]|uniref:NADase-type glycan-binding domain-containing protein n=1 Tax=uncultured Bacteroides sp. TaxID=162156 RepID=UPI0027DD99A9|nr:hypothetical protein [uncultured Bacteroides sp.]